jgi:hypothetical protein
MKTKILITTIMLLALIGVASAGSLQQYGGNLIYNTIQQNPQSQIWTLINQNSYAVPINIIIPKISNISITLSISNGTIMSANQILPVSVTVDNTGTQTASSHLVNITAYIDAITTTQANSITIESGVSKKMIIYTSTSSQQSSSSNQGGSSGGGGGGNSGSGTGQPQISQSGSCYTVYDFVQDQSISLNFQNVNDQITQNFITPSYAAITVNSIGHYNITLNQIVNIGEGITAETTNINYEPGIVNDTMKFCQITTQTTTVSTTSVSTTTTIPANTITTTSTSTIPSNSITKNTVTTSISAPKQQKGSFPVLALIYVLITAIVILIVVYLLKMQKGKGDTIDNSSNIIQNELK